MTNCKLSPAELVVCRALGVRPEDFAAGKERVEEAERLERLTSVVVPNTAPCPRGSEGTDPASLGLTVEEANICRLFGTPYQEFAKAKAEQARETVG